MTRYEDPDYILLSFVYRFTNREAADEELSLSLFYLDYTIADAKEPAQIIESYRTQRPEDGNKFDTVLSIREEGLMITDGIGLSAKEFIIDILHVNDSKKIQLTIEGYHDKLQKFQEIFRSADGQPPKQFHLLKI